MRQRKANQVWDLCSSPAAPCKGFRTRDETAPGLAASNSTTVGNSWRSQSTCPK